jgi:hypothetical protein
MRGPIDFERINAAALSHGRALPATAAALNRLPDDLRAPPAMIRRGGFRSIAAQSSPSWRAPSARPPTLKLAPTVLASDHAARRTQPQPCAKRPSPVPDTRRAANAPTA